MSLKEQITNDLKTALLGGDRFKGTVLRGLKAAILNKEVALSKREDGLSEPEIQELIATEIKRRRESLDIYQKNDRADLADVEQSEIDILSEYLPEQLSESDLQEIIKNKIEQLKATDMKMMGQVIGAVKQEVGVSADGALVAKLVKEQLTKA